ncbi:hypothetical protein ENSA7_03360 [Enhygromyxa salina]|uniref:Uncharacterized protein n=1 Tax=Enhygromyxa salina TaxID=215803 RepID=A0A2S9YXV9_9BACT|nr:hypothetical protein ENSA7_03360 [Enhygromyxa salina]
MWADHLQARGDPLGELVALSLRVDEVRRREPDATELAPIESQAEQLRLSLAEQLLGPGVGELPRLRLRWQHGVVRAVKLDPVTSGHADPPRVIVEVIAALVRRPALRFLDQLHLGALAPAREHELLDALTHPQCQARPRRVVLGRMPGQFRRLLRADTRPPAHHAPSPPPLSRPLLEAVAEAGVTWLVRWGWVQSLPWTAGDHGVRRQKLDALLEQPWSPALGRVFERAIWDTSLQVRRRILAALPTLGDGVAPALLAALAVDLDRHRRFGDLVERSLTRAASTHPSWVAGVAQNFSEDEPWVARWLAGQGQRSRSAARPAIPRIAGMLRRGSATGSSNDYRSHGLRRALHSFGHPDDAAHAAPFDDESIAELIQKLGAHRSPG